MLRWLTAGESHGPALMAVIEGLPAGVQVTAKNVQDALARRRLGYGRGARMKFEQDEVEFLGGLRHGVSLGSPIAIRIGNSEWPKWTTVMSPEPVSAEALAAADDVNAEKELARNKPLTRPRPGHADLVGMQKYGHTDARPVLERASARETAAQGRPRRGGGQVPRAGLRHPARVAHRVHRDRCGPDRRDVADPGRRRTPRRRPSARPRGRCIRGDGGRGRRGPQGRRHVGRGRRGARLWPSAGPGLPRPLGPQTGRPPGRCPDEYPGHQGRRDRRRLRDGASPRLAGARRDRPRRRCDQQAHRSSRRHRGRHVDGRAAPGERRDEADQHRPSGAATVDVATGEAATAIHQRSDVCAVPAAGVVAEAMVALVLAEACVEKFGGDSVTETARNHAAYLAAIPESLRTW